MERANQFVGQSLAFLDAVERASRAAPLNRPVLVIGERGTGKELIAERLHHLLACGQGLVTMNCAALPENPIEADVGHEAGSFTGAARPATAGSALTAAPCPRRTGNPSNGGPDCCRAPSNMVK
jgi:psp operon transcriptional activator